MGSAKAVEERIFSAFRPTRDRYLPLSGSGGRSEEEAELEVEFRKKLDWTTLRGEWIDRAPNGWSSALSFFSDEAFRFYLPAYLVADLRGELEMSDPLFHLTHGLDDASACELYSPPLLGSRTWYDHAAHRMSTFLAAEVDAIVAYLEWIAGREVKDRFIADSERESAVQALVRFWIPRSEELRNRESK